MSTYSDRTIAPPHLRLQVPALLDELPRLVRIAVATCGKPCGMEVVGYECDGNKGETRMVDGEPWTPPSMPTPPPT